MEINPPIYNDIIFYTGERGTVPQDVLRRRQLSMETMRRLGTPVLIKHRYNIDDVAKGTADFWGDTIYLQTTHEDPLTHGTGYGSVEREETEWVDPEGNIHIQPTGLEGWEKVSKYKGFGPGYLTYCILPDAPEDIFRLTSEGNLLHTQLSRTQLPWWPLCGDNDLMITVELDEHNKIIQTFDRYALRQVSPITMRGLNRKGRREYQFAASGNRFTVGQQCEAARVLDTDPLYQVEVDR